MIVLCAMVVAKVDTFIKTALKGHILNITNRIKLKKRRNETKNVVTKEEAIIKMIADETRNRNEKNDMKQHDLRHEAAIHVVRVHQEVAQDRDRFTKKDPSVIAQRVNAPRLSVDIISIMRAIMDSDHVIVMQGHTFVLIVARMDRIIPKIVMKKIGNIALIKIWNQNILIIQNVLYLSEIPYISIDNYFTYVILNLIYE